MSEASPARKVAALQSGKTGPVLVDWHPGAGCFGGLSSVHVRNLSIGRIIPCLAPRCQALFLAFLRFLAWRALAAIRAHSESFFGPCLRARASPPSLPSSAAALFFSGGIFSLF